MAVASGMAAVTLMLGASVAFGSSTVLGGGEPQSGLGQPHPRRVYFGGDLSTLIFDLQWKHWGTKVAYGSGKSYYVPPYARAVKARVIATSIGSCGRARAYMRVKVSKWTGTQWTRWYYLNACPEPGGLNDE